MTRRHNVRKLKLHRNYTAQELADVMDVGIGAVRAWTKAGLKPIDTRRPFLFCADTVAEFLEARNKPYQPSGPGQIYCVACKKTITPRDNVAKLVPLNNQTGNLIGTCPDCGRDVYRRVRLAEAPEKAGNLKVHHQDDKATLVGDGCPSHTPPNKE